LLAKGSEAWAGANQAWICFKAFSWDLRPDSDRTPPHQSTLQRCSDRPGGSHCELSPHCLVGVDNWNPANSKFHDRRQVPSPFLASASVGARLWCAADFRAPRPANRTQPDSKQKYFSTTSSIQTSMSPHEISINIAE